MSQFVIRIAQPSDADAVTCLLQNSYPVLMSGSYNEALLALALPRMTRANPALLASGRYFMALSQNGMAVGCGGWSQQKPGSGGREKGIGHVRHFATHAGWTGQGIGRRIYEQCEAQARAQGILSLECYSSLNAEPFYGALGFTMLDPIGIAMGDGIVVPSVHMRRLI